MTTQPASFSQFGQTLAFAERALTATLRRHLADRGTTPETWYALQLIATRGPRLDRETLIGDLAGSPALDADAAAELLAVLEGDGLIRGDSELDLTAEGSAFHASLRDYIAIPRNELLGQFEVGDIDTTVRTLRAITDSATARLAS
jgi:hypothetical protein